MGREDEIRIIAYALWIKDGCNHKNAVKRWLQAEAIWEQNRKGTGQSKGESDKGFMPDSDRTICKSHFSHTERERIVDPL
jgi:hypothetical protein